MDTPRTAERKGLIGSAMNLIGRMRSPSRDEAPAAPAAAAAAASARACRTPARRVARAFRGRLGDGRHDDGVGRVLGDGARGGRKEAAREAAVARRRGGGRQVSYIITAAEAEPKARDARGREAQAESARRFGGRRAVSDGPAAAARIHQSGDLAHLAIKTEEWRTDDAVWKSTSVSGATHRHRAGVASGRAARPDDAIEQASRRRTAQRRKILISTQADATDGERGVARFEPGFGRRLRRERARGHGAPLRALQPREGGRGRHAVDEVAGPRGPATERRRGQVLAGRGRARVAGGCAQARGRPRRGDGRRGAHEVADARAHAAPRIIFTRDGTPDDGNYDEPPFASTRDKYDAHSRRTRTSYFLVLAIAYIIVAPMATAAPAPCARPWTRPGRPPSRGE